MGTEAFWVPLALAAVSGGAQYANQTAAAKRQDQSEAQSIADQQAIRQKGTSAVNREVQDISKSNPNAIAAKETSNFVQNLRRNSAGSANPNVNSALAPVPGGSSRYNSSKAAGQAEAQNFGTGEASQLADLDAAVRQRQNEGAEMENTQTTLTGLGARSYAQNFVDQLRSQTAGQTNPWVGLFSALAGTAAQGASKNPQWFGGGKTSLASNSLVPQTINMTPTVAGGGTPVWS